MNVIVANKYSSMLQNLNIDVIKRLDGEFEVDDLIAGFKNFFFQRMILDITAIKNYKSIKTLQKLSVSLDMDKIILLLDDSPEASSVEYLSQLISIGIYNFTKNVEGVMYLYNNPNTYRDVAHIHQIEPVATIATPGVVTTSGIKVNQDARIPLRIIGIKNVTQQTGATTLAYMMKQQLSQKYDTLAIEIGKNDFNFFEDKDLISISASQMSDFIIKNSNKEVIIVDLNDDKHALELCNEIIYLFEPSTIKLNKIMMINPNLLSELKNKKIILNQSLLSPKDVLDFEYESRLKIYYNMPPLDERTKNSMALIAFLIKLGFTKLQK